MNRATVWSGDPAQFADYHDAAFQSSAITGLDGGSLVGFMTGANGTVARVWWNSPNSFADLAASGFPSTWCNGVSANTQVGGGETQGGEVHPLVWHGSSTSVIDLLTIALSGGNFGATGAASSGCAFATSGDLQVGYANRHCSQPIEGVMRHAAVWHAAQGWGVDLSIGGGKWPESQLAESTAYGIAGNLIVGEATVRDFSTFSTWVSGAYAWRRTADKAFVGVPLYSYLPPQYTASSARGVDPVTGQVVGQAGSEAFLWRPIKSQYLDVREVGSNLGVGQIAVQVPVDLRYQGGGSGDPSYGEWFLFREYRKGQAISIDPQKILSNYRVLDHIEVDGSPSSSWIVMDRDRQVKLFYRPGHPLTVKSSNPSSGVGIKVWTADAAGRTDGVTAFERVYPAGAQVSLTCPAVAGSSSVFDHWIKDGAPVAGSSRTLTLTMNAPHEAKAAYVMGSRLTVNSIAPDAGVPIAVYQADKEGKKDGVTQFSRIYASGTTISMTAPATVGAATFVRWQKEGNAQPPGVRTISVQMVGNRSVTAVYSGG